MARHIDSVGGAGIFGNVAHWPGKRRGDILDLRPALAALRRPARRPLSSGAVAPGGAGPWLLSCRASAEWAARTRAPRFISPARPDPTRKQHTPLRKAVRPIAGLPQGRAGAPLRG